MFDLLKSCLLRMSFHPGWSGNLAVARTELPLGSLAPCHELLAACALSRLVLGQVGKKPLLHPAVVLCFSVMGQTRKGELLPGCCRCGEALCLEHAQAIKCVMCASFKLTLLKQQCYF